ncbi:MAG: hypothetical protein V2A54_05450 [Bacteroidota bacterium]
MLQKKIIQISGIIILASIVQAGFVSCKCCKKNKTEKPARTIILGSGGGVTGKYVEHIINSDGTIMLDKLDKNPAKQIRTFDKSMMDKINAQFDALNFFTIKYNEPGNMNYYVKCKAGNQENKVQWGKPTKGTPPADVVKFYDTVYKFIVAD